jgi:hypothetical protein
VTDRTFKVNSRSLDRHHGLVQCPNKRAIEMESKIESQISGRGLVMAGMGKRRESRRGDMSGWIGDWNEERGLGCNFNMKYIQIYVCSN